MNYEEIIKKVKDFCYSIKKENQEYLEKNNMTWDTVDERTHESETMVDMILNILDPNTERNI
jgi:hypothetical protein